MGNKVGIVQTRGIGDIIIALPIADHFIEQGDEVFWPIDKNFLVMFERIKPDINFLPVEADAASRDFFLNEPIKLIRQHGCDRTIVLYSYLSGVNICDTRLARSLKFDEYKYAIAGVPFDRKWSLKFDRDMDREQALYDSLGITGEYVCVHGQGFNYAAPIHVPREISESFQVVRVEELTDSPFDWLLTFERASRLMMLDSSHANLVEQMNLPNPKQLYLRSDAQFTPVYKNGWQFSFFDRSDLQ